MLYLRWLKIPYPLLISISSFWECLRKHDVPLFFAKKVEWFLADARGAWCQVGFWTAQCGFAALAGTKLVSGGAQNAPGRALAPEVPGSAGSAGRAGNVGKE